MQPNQLPMCYYPTTVICVDDQKSFLSELKNSLDQNYLTRFYSNPHQVIRYFSEYQANPFIHQCMIADEDAQQQNYLSHHIDLRTIHQQIYNPTRFEQVSVLVADYAMPPMNGLECYSAIDDPYLKKLLLTGQAQHDLAVKAFNDKRIDHFIQKSQPNLMRTVNDIIHRLQLNYFIDLVDKSVMGQMPASLHDPAFIQLFSRLCQENGIVEYYLLDNQGSFLLLDRDANPFWLLVNSDAEMASLTAHAQGEEVSTRIVDALEKRQCVLYLHGGEDFSVSADNWGDYLYPATMLEGNTKYYYAFFSGSANIGIERQKVVSLRTYLKK